jgi:hypothetical protein
MTVSRGDGIYVQGQHTCTFHVKSLILSYDELQNYVGFYAWSTETCHYVSFHRNLTGCWVSIAFMGTICTMRPGTMLSNSHFETQVPCVEDYCPTFREVVEIQAGSGSPYILLPSNLLLMRQMAMYVPLSCRHVLVIYVQG